MFTCKLFVPRYYQQAISKGQRLVQLLQIHRNFQLLASTNGAVGPAFTRYDVASKEVDITQKGSKVPVNKYTCRTHTCGELTANNEGDHVHLYGWVDSQRLEKFILLRDSYGTIQLIVPDNNTDVLNMVEKLTLETVVSIQGKVKRRPLGQENKYMTSGDIEIIVESMDILNKATPNLPFLIKKFNKAGKSLQMKYRYLALRFPEMQKILRFRCQLIAKMRNYLIDCEFVEVETPTLFRSTPGGAQEFVVPTRQADHFYSLVQSPQQFKQLLMVGGIDRYFQVARCYRDEGTKPDRQPEFTQLDIEMSFVNRAGVIELVEDLMKHSWPKEVGSLNTPIDCVTYDEAMEFYGSDKPDLRIPYKIRKLPDVLLTGKSENANVCGILFPNASKHLTENVKDQFSMLAKSRFAHAQLLQCSGHIKSWTQQMFSTEQIHSIYETFKPTKKDVLFVAVGRKDITQNLLGDIRLEFANAIESAGGKVRTCANSLLWIIDFPLFSVDEETNEMITTHHPFTQPHPEDMHLLESDPLKVRSMHYDLVLNGCEIGGGSIRVHNANLQKRILEMLNIETHQLSHLLEALDSGAPPHGGIALGLDRLVSLLCNESSISNVMAFPKSSEGRDLMTDAPHPVSDKTKNLYHIKTLTQGENH